MVRLDTEACQVMGAARNGWAWMNIGMPCAGAGVVLAADVRGVVTAGVEVVDFAGRIRGCISRFKY